jgi:hypothetical protein
MDRLPETEVDFKSFEQYCYDTGMAFARMLMADVLTDLDIRLLNERDSGAYRTKGLRPLTVKTLMGEVTVKRRLYRHTDLDGHKEYVCLLDHAIGLDTIGRFSINLVHRMAEVISECSYRAAAETVGFLSGQKISHGGFWNVVQAVGGRISEADRRRSEFAKRFVSKGKKIVKGLQEEFDGVWINMQGKDRHKTGRKSEMKLAVSYEGTEFAGKRKDGRDSYRLVNPLYMAGFEKAEEFFRKKEGQIGAVYDLNEIDVRLINGDGGGWVQGFGERCGCEYHSQLDRFHIERELRRSGIAKEEIAKITGLFDQMKVTEGLSHLAMLRDKETDGDKKEKANKVFGYLNNNRNGLTPILKRGLALPNPKDGIVYGNMGAMESTVCGVVALRMKKRRASFTVCGATNLARLLCLKRSKRLDETMASLSDMRLPVTIEEAIAKVFSAAKAPKKDGQGFRYPGTAGLPFANAATTNGRNAIKGLCSYRELTDLVLR